MRQLPAIRIRLLPRYRFRPRYAPKSPVIVHQPIAYFASNHTCVRKNKCARTSKKQDGLITKINIMACYLRTLRRSESCVCNVIKSTFRRGVLIRWSETDRFLNNMLSRQIIVAHLSSTHTHVTIHRGTGRILKVRRTE